jgi:hypothetical protein
MKTKVLTTICATALLFSQVALSGWGSASLFKETELTLAPDGLSRFVVDVGAGDIHIEGQKGIDEIQVKARIYGDGIDESDYRLVLKKRGSKAYLEAHSNSDDKAYKNKKVKIDLMVSMPPSLALELDDRSGDITVSSLESGLVVNDRSGDIELNDIRGDIRIEDRSGDVTGRDLGGNVIVDDRSGDIHLESLGGNVTVDDSSGDVYVKEAAGKVTVSDSSGDIRINGAGDFKLARDSSGDVKLRNIRDRQ